MSLVGFVSAKGSPGATTTAVAVASAWPNVSRRSVVVEADPAGGVLAIRFGLTREPGLTSMAAAARNGLARGGVWEHVQQLANGLPVVVAPDSPGEAAASLSASAATLGVWLQGITDVDVMVDLGRLSPSPPAMGLVGSLDVVVVVARPVAEQTQAAAELLHRLRGEGTPAGWCLIGERPHTPTDVEAAYGMPVFGVLADDAHGAATVASPLSEKRRRRSVSDLPRSATGVAAHLASWLHPPAPTTPPPAVVSGEIVGGEV